MSQLAAIVVTDLVGSTELRARLGEERADELRRTHDRVLGDVVRAGGGEIVKGMGDGLLARFGGAAAAAAAAVEMQRAALAALDEVGAGMRVGVAVGEVSVEDNDVFGMPVIEAARLCAAAEGGQILVADLVRVLGQGRGDHTFVPRGPLDLKGLPAPVEVCEVTWEPTLAPSSDVVVPLPVPLASSDRFAYAGRAGTRDLLAERWELACRVERQVLLLAGEPGIGKTRLAAELARDVAADGAVVTLGRCFDDIAAPYAPFTEALGHLVRHVPLELLDAHVATVGPDLSRIVPDLGRRLALPQLLKGDAELERVRLFEAVVDLLARIGEHVPVLLVLDDLHWADASTVELLLWLARSACPMRLAVVGTYRDTDVARTHPFGAALAELRRTPATERVAVVGLDQGEVGAFLEGAGAQLLDEEGLAFALRLHAETEGNPFFLQELLVHLVETSALVRDGDRWIAKADPASIGVPEGVRDVVGRRLSLLDDDINNVLRAAAVVGLEFELGVLEQLAGLDAERLLDLAEEPRRRGLLVEGGVDRYRFSHALIRQTLYEELPAGRRARLHRAAADALEARGAPVAEVAHHLIESGPRGDAGRATALAGAAAAEAVRSLAWEQAVRWYVRALDQAELADSDNAVRAALLVGHGAAMNMIGRPGAARSSFVEGARLAEAAGDGALLAEAAIGYGGRAGAWLEYGDVLGLDLLDRADRAVAEEDVALRSRIAARKATWRLLDTEKSEMTVLAERAVELARRSGDPALLVNALVSGLDSEGAPTLEYETFAARVDELAAAAAATDDVSHQATALQWRAFERLRAGAFREAAVAFLDWRRFAEASGDVGETRMAGLQLNMIELLAGRVDEASQYLAERPRSLHPGEELTALAQETVIAAHRGDIAEYVRLWEVLDAEHDPVVSGFPWHAGVAAIEGRPDDAVREIWRWRRDVRPRCLVSLRAYLDISVAWVMSIGAEDPELAGWLYEELAPHAGTWVVGGAAPMGSHALWLGALARMSGRPDMARTHLLEALASHMTEGALLWVPTIELELARMAVASGDAAEADRRTDSARSIADACGLSWARSAAEALRADAST